jgi:hypothetical protein
MLLDICLSERNLLLNGDFIDPTSAPWTLTGLWSYSAPAGTLTKLVGAWSTGYQISPVANGTLVRITVDVEVYEQAVLLQFGTQLEVVNQTGVYTFWAVADSLLSVGFVGNSDSSFKLKELTMTAINTNFVVEVIDVDDVVVFTFNSVDDPAYFNFQGGFMTCSYDWLDGDGECLPDGCYRLRVSDPCDCGNGGFVAEDFVTIRNQWQYNGSSWLVAAGVANFNGAVSGDYCFVDHVVCDGEDYEVTYTLANMVGNTFRITLGVGSGATQTADGTYTETITANGVGLSLFRMIGTNTGGASAFQVTDLTIRRVERSFNFLSNTFSLMQDTGCTLVVSACDDEDNLQGGFNGTGFTPQVRLAVVYGQGFYKSESKEYEFNSGRKDVYYFRSRKILELSFGCPSYIHDFMATLRGYSHVFLDGAEMFIESEEYPRPKYIERWDWAEAVLDVSKKIELTEKVVRNTIVKTCSADGGDVPIAADGGANDNAVITTTEGEILSTDG